jgi:hypothetical protein
VSEADRQKWDGRFAAVRPSFDAHELGAVLLAHAPPPGPVLELAAGPSGTTLALAAAGRVVLAVDVSAIALAQLGAEAERRGLGARVQTQVVDLDAWRPPRATFAAVFATRFWDPDVFVAACAAVAPGGLVGWETFTLAQRRYRPGFAARYCWDVGEPLAPPGFDELVRVDRDDGQSATRRLVARRRP